MYCETNAKLQKSYVLMTSCLGNNFEYTIHIVTCCTVQIPIQQPTSTSLDSMATHWASLAAGVTYCLIQACIQ